MGNHASGERRDRHKSGENYPYSPGRVDGQAFNYEKRGQNKLVMQNSEEEHDPVVVLKKKAAIADDSTPIPSRPMPVVKGNKKMLPFVIKWTGGGNNVAIAGSFNQWNQLTMVKSEKDFVAIVDLPEGEHEYKFYVDGEWKTNPQEQMVDSSIGTQNNIISIKDKDFEEFENALLKDPNDKKEKFFGGETKEVAKEEGGLKSQY
ncbi:unnamed protein product, partial [Meganyctiphanes norvegica]